MVVKVGTPNIKWLPLIRKKGRIKEDDGNTQQQQQQPLMTFQVQGVKEEEGKEELKKKEKE